MPVMRRYVMRREKTILLFTKKPVTVLKRRWYDGRTNLSSPHAYLQKVEFESGDYRDLEEGKLYEVEIRVKLKQR